MLARLRKLGRSTPADHLDTVAPIALHTVTQDGVLLRLERYQLPGAQPVVLLHGWMQSPRGMDSPVAGRSIARYLHRQGFDVFVGCLRGHGDGRARSGSNGHWTPGDHAALDLPAIVRIVRARTGREPMLVGHSLGGLVALMYLAGASVDQGTVAPCEQTAARRRATVAGVVALAPPLAFPQKSIGLFSERPDLSGKLLCKFGASRIGGKLLSNIPNIPLQSAIRAITGAPGIGRAATAAIVRLCSGNSARGFWRPENMSRELIASELQHTLDATSGAELRNMAEWVVRGGLIDSDGVNWTAALRWVKAPVLIVVGDRDGVSTVEGVRVGSRSIGSEDLELLVIEDAGHNDLRVGRKAASHVYPALNRWLRARSKREVRTKPGNARYSGVVSVLFQRKRSECLEPAP